MAPPTGQVEKDAVAFETRAEEFFLALLPQLGELALFCVSIIILLQAKPKSPIRTWQSRPWRKMFLGCGIEHRYCINFQKNCRVS